MGVLLVGVVVACDPRLKADASLSCPLDFRGQFNAWRHRAADEARNSRLRHVDRCSEITLPRFGFDQIFAKGHHDLGYTGQVYTGQV